MDIFFLTLDIYLKNEMLVHVFTYEIDYTKVKPCGAQYCSTDIRVHQCVLYVHQYNVRCSEADTTVHFKADIKTT